MARQKRWTIPFKSLNGTDCRVDIYEEGWTGAVTELSTANATAPGFPADDPFYYEEDNDSDLLNVIRVKTGYLTLIETAYGSLEDLYPETDTEHYIEFYYGARLDFVGFMQAQAFDNEWTAPPRTLSFPIMSPLGLIENLKFTPRNPVAELSFRQYLAEVVSGLDAAYTGYYLPQGTNENLLSYIITPFNESVDKTDGSDMYDPMTYKDFLEGICNLFGLILHDTPTMLIFSKYDYNGIYEELANSATFDSDSVEDLEDNFTIASDEGEESMVRPLGKITVKYEGQQNTQRTVSVGRMAYISYSIVNIWSGTPTWFGAAVAWMKMFSPEFYSSFMQYSNDLTPGLMPTNKGVIGAVIGSKECVVVYCDSHMGDNTRSILEWRISLYPGYAESGYVKITLGVTKHTTIQDEGEASNPFYISVEIDGDYYDDTNYEFNNTVHKYAPDVNGKFWIKCNVPRYGVQMKITLWGSASCTDGALYTIDNFMVEAQPVKMYQYREEYKMEREIEGSVTSPEEGQVSMVMSRDHFNTRSLAYAGSSGYTAPTYPYLMLAQNRLVMDFKGTKPDEKDLYLYKWAYWISGWHWRIIAQSFHPWDDKYQLTMHRSSTI